MEPKVRFLLKNPKAKKSTAIFMLYSWGYSGINSKGNKAYIPLKYATKKSVSPKEWNGKRAKGKLKTVINNELDSIENTANRIFAKHQDVGLTTDSFRMMLDKELGREIILESENELQNVVKYTEHFILQIESGQRKTQRDATKSFSPGSVKAYRSFKNKIQKYNPKLEWDDIDMKFYLDFINYLEKQHKRNTVGRYIKNLKTVMQKAFDDDIHTNQTHRKSSFKAPQELVDTIYLNEDEIKDLFEYKPVKGYKTARDLFIIGYLTAQRISDWHQVSKDNLTTTVKGVRVFRFRQEKTNTLVTIPYVDPRLISIMEEYDFRPPVLAEQRVNLYIKEVCKAVGISDKADLVTTHTARRSACTNMYKAGIPIGKIMKITGHSTESEFKKYIRVTDDEVAEDLSTHKYFTR